MSSVAPSRENSKELGTSLIAANVLQPEDVLINLAVDLENRRRALMCQLRLIAHRINHGAYPESLNEAETLVEFRDIDSSTGFPFEYEHNPTPGPVYVTEPLDDYFVVSDTPRLTSPASYSNWRRRKRIYALP